MVSSTAFLTCCGIDFGRAKFNGSDNMRRPNFVNVAKTRRTRIPMIFCSTSDDYYEVLGLKEDADTQAVKRAYRRAALKNHPDVSDAPDARERFLRVQEAYSVLSNPQQRETYDRNRRAAGAAASSGFGGFGSDMNAAEFARRWRERNPMPKDLDDSLGNIFSDLFSGVANAVNSSASASGGVVEDFIEFLERRVDGFASDRRKGDPDSLDDVLRSNDEDVLRAEADDARFVIEQLTQRRRKAQAEEDSLRERVRKWRDRADRANLRRDYETRDAARDRAKDLVDEARRFARRVDETATHIRKQEDRLRRIERRLKDVQASPVVASNSSKKSRNNTSQSQTKNQGSAIPNEKSAIDSELEKMKRELGL